MKIAVEHASKFEVEASLEQVFGLLADVPRSVSHFPDLAKLVPMDAGTYRWEMEPIGAMSIQLQVVYACRYVNDDDGRGLAWLPVAGVGNGLIGGRWKLKEHGEGTQLDFATDGELDVPVPAPLRPLARPAVERQFHLQVQRYLDNLRDALNR